MSLTVTLKGAASTEQGVRAGIYNIAPTFVNQRVYWIQQDGNNALWYVNGRWMIGSKGSLGVDNGGLSTEPTENGPLSADWRYYDDDKFHSGKDLITISYTGILCKVTSFLS